jgi:hypothetical protein
VIKTSIRRIALVLIVAVAVSLASVLSGYYLTTQQATGGGKDPWPWIGKEGSRARLRTV